MASVHFGPRLAGAAFFYAVAADVPMNAEWIGWLSSAVLLATLMRQVYTQWREHSDQGVSRWLFIGQLLASTGFLIYSVLVRNWVFMFTNAALLLTAMAGQLIYWRNKRDKH